MQSFPLSFCVCAHICMCAVHVYMCASVYSGTYVSVCRGHMSTLSVFLNRLSSYILKQDLSLVLEFINLARVASQQASGIRDPPVSAHSWLPGLGIQAHTEFLFFSFISTGGRREAPNSGSEICKSPTLEINLYKWDFFF